MAEKSESFWRKGWESQVSAPRWMPRINGLALVIYLRSPRTLGAIIDPLRKRMEARVFPKALPTVLGLGAAGPVVLHVGVGFTTEPTDGATYEPTDGATDDPYPESPACASAAVLERAKAVANAIVLSFMFLSLCAAFLRST